MSVFELLGAALLLGGGARVAVMLCAFERRRCKQAEGFLALARCVREGIECFSIPIAEIFAKCDAKIWADCGVGAQDFSDFPSLLDACTLYLPRDMKRLLLDFSERLGGGYREEQLRCCDYFLERFTPCCDRLRAELPRRERIAWLLPLSVAAILLLMLL